MTKRAIPANRVYRDIDDFLAYHYSSERAQLSNKSLLHSFIDKWEQAYFFTLRKLKNSKEQEDKHLNEDARNIKYTHLAMKEILNEIPSDLYF